MCALITDERLKTPEELAKIIEAEKKNGKKVVFTNGVFDFVHIGHARCLELAREMGDMLVVAINSDASVKRIKGPSRPINNQRERAYVLAALSSVDYVTVFEDDTATKILDQLKPSIHAKGGDYTPDSLPEDERSVMKKNNGEIRIIPLEKGYVGSNSNQFEKIRQAAEMEAEFKRSKGLASADAKDAML